MFLPHVHLACWHRCLHFDLGSDHRLEILSGLFPEVLSRTGADRVQLTQLSQVACVRIAAMFVPLEDSVREFFGLIGCRTHLLQLLDFFHRRQEIEPATVHFDPLGPLMLVIPDHLAHRLAVVLAKSLLRNDVALNHVLLALSLARASTFAGSR